MKTIIKIILILLLFQSCINNTEEKLRNNTWIDTRGSKIIEVIGDSILITHYFKHSEKFYFQLKNNEIILDDTISFGLIDSITKNQFFLKSKTNNFTKDLFVPVEKVSYKMDTTGLKNLLLSCPWKFSLNESECRFDFMDYNWFIPNWKYLWSTQNIGGIEDLDVKDWTVKEYNGTLFLLVIERGSDLLLFQINNLNDSILYTTASFDKCALFDSLPVKMELNKISPVDEHKFNMTKKMLSDSKWDLFDYTVLAKNYKIYDGIYRNFNPGKRRILYGDTIKRVYENYYLDKSINYIFTKQSNGYLIAENDTLRRGKWVITKDGKYLFTNPPSFFSCLKIIELTDTFLMFEQVQTIEFLDERNYEKRYIREKLIRQNTLPNKQIKKH